MGFPFGVQSSVSCSPCIAVVVGGSVTVGGTVCVSGNVQMLAMSFKV